MKTFEVLRHGESTVLATTLLALIARFLCLSVESSVIILELWSYLLLVDVCNTTTMSSALAKGREVWSFFSTVFYVSSAHGPLKWC